MFFIFYALIKRELKKDDDQITVLFRLFIFSQTMTSYIELRQSLAVNDSRSSFHDGTFHDSLWS